MSVNSDRKEYKAQEPNFYDKQGNLFLVRCPTCKRENYAPAVASGECAWCGWTEYVGVIEVDPTPVA